MALFCSFINSLQSCLAKCTEKCSQNDDDEPTSCYSNPSVGLDNLLRLAKNVNKFLKFGLKVQKGSKPIKKLLPCEAPVFSSKAKLFSRLNCKSRAQNRSTFYRAILDFHILSADSSIFHLKHTGTIGDVMTFKSALDWNIRERANDLNTGNVSKMFLLEMGVMSVDIFNVLGQTFIMVGIE